MDSNQIQEKIVGVLANISDNKNLKLDPETNFFDSGLLDSLAFIQFIVELSEGFKIDISPSQVERCDLETLSKATSFVSSNLDAKK